MPSDIPAAPARSATESSFCRRSRRIWLPIACSSSRSETAGAPDPVASSDPSAAVVPAFLRMIPPLVASLSDRHV